MRNVWIIGLLLLASATAASSSWIDPEIGGLVAELEVDGLGDERRESIFNQLRAAAGGELIEERTAEAILALARYLPADRTIGEKDDNLFGRMITLYSDDPRIVHVLIRQARRKLASKDAYEAHFTLTRLLTRAPEAAPAELRIRAAANAIVVGDLASAMEWSSLPDGTTLERELEQSLWRTRLTAAQRLGRYTEALEALEALDRLDPEAGKTLATDAAALLAAARTEVAAGRLDAAESHYRDFVNVHSRSSERAAAMLEHAELLARLQRIEPARRVVEWMFETYPNAPETSMARVRDIEWNPALTPRERAAAYRETAVDVETEAAATTACDDLLELLIAEGRPLAAVSELTWMIRNTRGFGAIAARRSLLRGTGPAIKLLASRDDRVGIAAAASALAAVGLPVPDEQRELVESARRALGLRDGHPALERAESLAREGQWDQVNRLLAHTDRARLDDATHVRTTLLAAEALWRLGRTEPARSMVEQTLATRELEAASERPLIVLGADIDFAADHLAQACVGYRAAVALRETPYVAGQVGHCDRLEPATGTTTETAP